MDTIRLINPETNKIKTVKKCYGDLQDYAMQGFIPMQEQVENEELQPMDTLETQPAKSKRGRKAKQNAP